LERLSVLRLTERPMQRPRETQTQGEARERPREGHQDQERLQARHTQFETPTSPPHLSQSIPLDDLNHAVPDADDSAPPPKPPKPKTETETVSEPRRSGRKRTPHIDPGYLAL